MNPPRFPSIRLNSRAAVGRFVGLLLVSAFAVAVMLASAGGRNGPKENGAGISSSDLLKAPAPVAVRELKEERINVIHTYSGMIRPKDRHSVGFEVAGRVEWIKRREDGTALVDVGDRVRKDEVLARLDERILQARKREVSARLTLARDNLERAIETRRRVETSVTLAEIQRLRSEVDVALAQLDIAEQQLADISLLSPVDGVIARRMVEQGETVNAHQVLFEIVTIDEVVLVVGVPESRLPEITRRRREVRQNLAEAARAVELGQPDRFEAADLEFRASVRQLGEDRFGRPWPQRDATIFQIAETADDRTGLFEVEVLIDNRDRSLRPGFIALADIVIDRIDGYRLPTASVQFRDRKAFLFTAAAAKDAAPETDAGKFARRHELQTYIEQADSVIIPTRIGSPATQPPLPGGKTMAVVRGQHRLVDGRPLEIVNPDASPEATVGEETEVVDRLGGLPSP